MTRNLQKNYWRLMILMKLRNTRQTMLHLRLTQLCLRSVFPLSLLDPSSLSLNRFKSRQMKPSLRRQFQNLKKLLRLKQKRMRSLRRLPSKQLRKQPKKRPMIQKNLLNQLTILQSHLSKKLQKQQRLFQKRLMLMPKTKINQRNSRPRSCLILTMSKLMKSCTTLGLQTLIRLRHQRRGSVPFKRETKTYRLNTRLRISQRLRSTSLGRGSKKTKMSNTRLKLSAQIGLKNATKNLTGWTWRALMLRRANLTHAAKLSRNSSICSNTAKVSIKGAKNLSQRYLSS